MQELSSFNKDYPIAEEILERLKPGNGVLHEGVRYPTRRDWGPNPDLMMAFVPTCHFRKVSGTPRKDSLVRRSRPSMPKSS
jgi:hypothetical protein